jgi:hypothetical protein
MAVSTVTEANVSISKSDVTFAATDFASIG